MLTFVMIVDVAVVAVVEVGEMCTHWSAVIGMVVLSPYKLQTGAVALERNVLLAYEPLPIDTRNYRLMLAAYCWLGNVGRAQNDHHISVKCHDNDPAVSYDTLNSVTLIDDAPRT